MLSKAAKTVQSNNIRKAGNSTDNRLRVTTTNGSDLIWHADFGLKAIFRRWGQVGIGRMTIPA